jgi:hypothetical protein
MPKLQNKMKTTGIQVAIKMRILLITSIMHAACRGGTSGKLASRPGLLQNILNFFI